MKVNIKFVILININPFVIDHETVAVIVYKIAKRTLKFAFATLDNNATGDIRVYHPTYIHHQRLV